MKHLTLYLFLVTAANATVLLDSRTNTYNFTNDIVVGSVTVSNYINTSVASGAVAIAGGTFTGATFNPQTTLAGISNTVFLGRMGGGITSGTLTVDGSLAAFGIAAPTSGTYFAKTDAGTVGFEPVLDNSSASLNRALQATAGGVTNIFTVAGRTTQTWTWTGSSTTIVIKAWGASGGNSYSGANSVSGSGPAGFIQCTIRVTNQMTLSIIVGYGGGWRTTQYVSTVNESWPGGGTYTTNSTSGRGGGGGCSIIYHGTNLVLVAAGNGGSQDSSYAGGSGGWPNGGSGSGGNVRGGTQTSGGNGIGGGTAGSYLQGGNASTGVFQSCGGCGYYGGGSEGTATGYYGGGGGSSYFNPAYALFGYGTLGVNSGDINYSSSYGTTIVSGTGQNGIVYIITPTP